MFGLRRDSVLLRKHYKDDQTEEEMGGICNLHEPLEKLIRNFITII